MDPDYYAILQLEPDCTKADIQRQYRRLALLCHPDRNGGDPRFHEQLRQLNEAYDVLMDPASRARYDAGRRRASPPRERSNAFEPRPAPPPQTTHSHAHPRRRRRYPVQGPPDAEPPSDTDCARRAGLLRAALTTAATVGILILAFALLLWWDYVSTEPEHHPAPGEPPSLSDRAKAHIQAIIGPAR